MPADTPQEFARQRMVALFGLASQLRLAGLPIAAVVVGAVLLLDDTPWRRVKLGLGLLWVVGLSVAEWWRFRRQPSDRGAFNFLAMTPVQVGVVVATGGLESPFTPILVFLPAVGALVLGPGWRLGLVLALVHLGIWGSLATHLSGVLPDFLPTFYGGGPRSSPSDALLWSRAIVHAGAGGVGVFAALRLRGFVAQTMEQLWAQREERLAEERRHQQELLLLTAEIAHELKNPLASVRGLSDLLADGPPLPGRGGPRLTVLREEVGRMAGILDEFLNFSRPLSPLRIESADLLALGAAVIGLHEGVAAARGHQLRLNGPALWAPCDPRKIQQVLVNLVQNALDASPPGGAVTLTLAEEGAAYTLTITDQGPGPVPGRDHFEPGLTEKAHGSGLGLTIARAIARQHGGEVTLERGPQGGGEATLRLPRSGPPLPATPTHP